MADHAISTDPAVQQQLDRLSWLSPGADILGLDRISRLLERLGNPQLRLPPQFHVAGTNGKGSTCAYLRAALEAAGKRVHVYTSPHLVRFNERIRLAGHLIEDVMLASLLAEVLDAGGDIGASFFEVTTAAAFLAFARVPADACVVEVGLGGRLDATNVLRDPAACGIAQLGIDHQAFLGETLVEIAGEKAGIAKPGRPLLLQRYPDAARTKVVAVAKAAGARGFEAGKHWDFAARDGQLHYRDAQGELITPLPLLPGEHQQANLALALAMLRHQDRITLPTAALEQAAHAVRWPARMQRLSPGPLTAMVPEDVEVWLDGGHNPAAGQALAAALSALVATPGGIDRPLHVILGMLANKDATGLLAPLAGQIQALVAVPVPGHACHTPAALAQTAQTLGIRTTGTAPDVSEALRLAGRGDPKGMPPVVLILGSLYLAGTVLAANEETPD